MWPVKYPALTSNIRAHRRRTDTATPEQLPDLRRSLTVDSPAKQLFKLALSQDTAWQVFAIACSNF